MIGLVQGANAPASTLHWKLELGLLEEKVIVGVGSFEAAGGGVSIVVCGGTVSTEKFARAASGSTLPSASVARTSKLWGPSARAARVIGLVQGVKAPASTLHWKLELGLLEEKLIVGVGSFEAAGGGVSIVVCGDVVSTVKFVRPASRRRCRPGQWP